MEHILNFMITCLFSTMYLKGVFWGILAQTQCEAERIIKIDYYETFLNTNFVIRVASFKM